ncbi:MAG: TPM domain-containing protein [Flavobacteriales bacterium]|nr:TPM domain-containing protein [Flavobacteriales bacterium]MBK9288421.1 TPM domain-containing protein [Flavobacteriales bacterium]MBL0035995.1 TPM domain-containing protein [Flavobacteriales bacterium]
MAAQDLLSEAERERVLQAIHKAEERTSGEVRVHLDDTITDNVLDHAAFVFEELGMFRTRDRNGVLIYVSLADRQAAVIGDAGINARVPEGFWDDVLALLREDFSHGRFADGLCKAIGQVGEKLHTLFPYQRDDRNELPNDISFG